MKSTFETEEDLKFLHKLLWRGVMSTDQVFDSNFIEDFPEYASFLIKFRKKCFEYFEEPDPNEAVISHLKVNLMLGKNQNE